MNGGIAVLTRRTDISGELLWSYVEGRLEERTCEAITRYLDQHPEMLRTVRIMRKQQEFLETADPGVLQEPVPRRLTDVIERARLRLNDSYGPDDESGDG